MKNIITQYNIKYFIIITLFVNSVKINAQTPSDHLMMQKGLLCNVISYSNNSWTNYWEGTTKRSNTNLGTVTTQNVMYMGALGITNKLNVIAGLPYVWTRSTKSYLAGQSGIQDLSLWVKYQFLNKKGFNAFATLGGTLPMSHYVPDFMPFSIGTQSKSASGRVIMNYSAKNGLYFTAQGGITLRSNVKIDRNSFLFNNKLYDTNEMPVPNIGDGSVSIGFLNKKCQTALSIERFACLTGDNIRYNDAPLLSNKMSATSVAWFGKYNIKQFAITANIGKVIKGQNVGESTNITLGALYYFQVFKKHDATK